MDSVNVSGNERSEVIEVIKIISSFCEKNDLKIKDAGGESTVSKNKKSMFPDIIMYGDKTRTVILQGWECKMPDTPIEDQTNIDNAKNKAITLNLNSFMVWNFSHGVLYQRKNKTDKFEQVKTWSSGIDTEHFIGTREDVKTYKDEWKELIESIITEINTFFVKGEFVSAPLGDIIAETAISTIIERNRQSTADYLKTKATSDSRMEAYIDDWWSEIECEYISDKIKKKNKSTKKEKYNEYAKYILMNWCNRILFAHLIKVKQNAAFAIDSLDDTLKPNDANKIFKDITEKSDFYNVFETPEYNYHLPVFAWNDIIEFSLFLKDHNIDSLQQKTLQNILEKTVSTSKREINGQYTTPYVLARILLRLTVEDWNSTILDCCCGTGTIPRAAIDIKKEKGNSAKNAIGSVWACDKFSYPLQAANLSMVSSDTINLANILFKHNALTLEKGETISVTDPKDGSLLKLTTPLFDNIVVNLPFVSSSMISQEDRKTIEEIKNKYKLTGRSDLSYFIAIKMAELLKDNGSLGIIVSNSWLGTEAGHAFFAALNEIYQIKQVHISGAGKWFNNAEVVTTLIIAEKKAYSTKGDITFWLWNKTLEELSENSDIENQLINSAILEKEKEGIARKNKYTQEELTKLNSLCIYNGLFHDAKWVLEILDKLVHITDVFEVFRGSRRGCNDFFYIPKENENNIENAYLFDIQKNCKSIKRLETAASSEVYAFCCNVELNQLDCNSGAYKWIDSWKSKRNPNKGNKLWSEILATKKLKWYELSRNEIAEIITSANPDQRLFFAKLTKPAFIDQRIIGFSHTKKYPDLDLSHALLNSVLSLYFLEASGFGRGEGVLDINKTVYSQCYMFDPAKISSANRKEILQKFDALKKREIKDIQDELEDKKRIEFELAVLKSYGLESYFDTIKNALLSMIKARRSVK